MELRLVLLCAAAVAAAPDARTPDFGAGLVVHGRPQGHAGHFNPFLPDYRPDQLNIAPNFNSGGSIVAEEVVGANTQSVQQEIDPADLNLNPGTGNSGPLGALVADCASGLNCVPNSQCDPYTGFVVGVLQGPPANPNQPTVALQRCRRPGPVQDGVCCRGVLGASTQLQPNTDVAQTHQGGGRPFPHPGHRPNRPPGRRPGHPGRGPNKPGRGPNKPGRGPNKPGRRPGGGRPGDFSHNPFLSSLIPGGGSDLGAVCAQGETCMQANVCPGGATASQQNCRTGSGSRGVCCPERASIGPGPIPVPPPGQTSLLTCDPVIEECVTADLCGPDGFIVSDGAGLINARFGPGSDAYCLTGESLRGVCCLRPSATSAPPVTSGQVACQPEQQCVTPDLCDAQGRIITDGSGLLNARFGGVNQQEYCLTDEGFRGTCCLPGESTPTAPGRREIFCFEEIEECVAPELCDSEGFIIEDGAGLLDVRFNSREYCRIFGGGGGEGVCCRPRPPPVTPPTSRPVTCRAEQECVAPDLCDENGHIITDGFGLLDIRFDKNREYCANPEGGRGVCCEPAPKDPPPGRQETLCFPEFEECVAPDLCDSEGFIVEDGAGLLDIRFNSQSFCRRADQSKGVCCRPRPATNGQITCQANQECVTPDLCDEQGHIITDGAGLLDIRFDKRKQYCLTEGGERGTCCSPDPGCTSCGLGSVGIRIQGVNPQDSETQFGELPWQALLFHANFSFICGASLVGKRHVITAAHCVQYLEPDDVKIRLGEYQANVESEPQPHQDVAISAIHIHPNYKRGPLFNDIAVLELAEPAQIDVHIQPICLPTPGQQFQGRCVASGWGKDTFEGEFSTIMKQVRLPMVDNSACESALKETRLGRFFKLDSSFVCAGGEGGLDACEGDGGGPLACSVQGRHVLAGVTSWGIGCGTKGLPGVYASTTAAIEFIREKMDGKTCT